MTSSLPLRRLAEVEAKLRSLDAELQHWKDLTEEEGRGLRRHHSQMVRLGEIFHGLTESVRESIRKVGSDSAVLENVESWENQILAAHSIWEVFRSKFVMREDELFRDVLFACDDLVWSCYRPAMARFSTSRKEPPLVYFTTTWSPFAVSRDASFQNEIRSGAGVTGALGDEAFFQVLRRLPIPLVGLPWYQAFHLPGALVIGHETGHVVESDFDLTGEIAAALDAAPLHNRETWKRWASEVFADLYGCLCLGPAFVGAMMDLLAVSVTAVRTEERKTGKYPTRALRVELMLTALVQNSHQAEATRLRSAWEATYGPPQRMLDFMSDLPAVVTAIYAGPYQGTSLLDITSFPKGDALTIQTIGEAARGGFSNMLADYHDPRLLFAGAQWLHENRQAGQDPEAYTWIVKQVIKRDKNQFRAPGETVETKIELDNDLEQLRETDRITGRDLQSLILSDATSPGASGELPLP
jgi:hypothetical protein